MLKEILSEVKKDKYKIIISELEKGNDVLVTLDDVKVVSFSADENQLHDMIYGYTDDGEYVELTHKDNDKITDIQIV